MEMRKKPGERKKEGKADKEREIERDSERAQESEHKSKASHKAKKRECFNLKADWILLFASSINKLFRWIHFIFKCMPASSNVLQ